MRLPSVAELNIGRKDRKWRFPAKLLGSYRPTAVIEPDDCDG